MSKTRFAALLVVALLVAGAVVAPPAAQAGPCLCEILCWQQGTQWCRQDECCHLYCCDLADPTCSPDC